MSIPVRFLCTKFEQKVSSHIKIFDAIAGGVENTKYQVETVGLGRMEHLFLQCDMISGQLNFKGALQKKKKALLVYNVH